MRCVIFQSTLPRGERPITGGGKHGTYYFNPRSHEGSDIYRQVHYKGFMYFNPRSHEGSDQCDIHNKHGSKISIHAPTRGATLFRIKYTPFRVFQSTLPRGERLSIMSFLFAQKYFNPRSHEGSDGNAEVITGSNTGISIHAPTRGATAIFAKKFSFLSAKIV